MKKLRTNTLRNDMHLKTVCHSVEQMGWIPPSAYLAMLYDTAHLSHNKD